MYLPNNEVLKILGYRIAREIVFVERRPEEKLYVYVLVNAFEDVMIHQSDRKSSLIKFAAHNWLIGMSHDFCKICEWALLDPEDIKNRYILSLEKKVIKFTQRQVLWKHYHNVHTKIKSLSDKEKRRQKGTLRHLRTEALSSPTNFVTTLFLSTI